MPPKSKKKPRSPSPSSSRTPKKKEYSSMSHKELQSLAKKRGIKANLKSKVLIEQLYLSDKPGIKISPRRKKSIQDYLYDPIKKLPIPDELIDKIKGHKLSAEERSRNNKENIQLIKDILNNEVEGYINHIPDLQENHRNFMFNINYKKLINQLNINTSEDVYEKFGNNVLKYMRDFVWNNLASIDRSIESINEIFESELVEESKEEIDDREDGLQTIIRGLNQNLLKLSKWGIYLKPHEIYDRNEKIKLLNKNLKKYKLYTVEELISDFTIKNTRKAISLRSRRKNKSTLLSRKIKSNTF